MLAASQTACTAVGAATAQTPAPAVQYLVSRLHALEAQLALEEARRRELEHQYVTLSCPGTGASGGL